MNRCEFVAGAGVPAVLKALKTILPRERQFGAPMGDARVAGAMAVLSVAILGFGTPAGAQKPSAKSDMDVVAAPGVTVRQEPVQKRLIYLEQKGGLVTPLPPPVPANVPEPAVSLAPGHKSDAAAAPAKKSRKSAT